jgi:hypothetical protein
MSGSFAATSLKDREYKAGDERVFRSFDQSVCNNTVSVSVRWRDVPPREFMPFVPVCSDDAPGTDLTVTGDRH